MYPSRQKHESRDTKDLHGSDGDRTSAASQDSPQASDPHRPPSTMTLRHGGQPQRGSARCRPAFLYCQNYNSVHAARHRRSIGHGWRDSTKRKDAMDALPQESDGIDLPRLAARELIHPCFSIHHGPRAISETVLMLRWELRPTETSDEMVV